MLHAKKKTKIYDEMEKMKGVQANGSHFFEKKRARRRSPEPRLKSTSQVLFLKRRSGLKKGWDPLILNGVWLLPNIKTPSQTANVERTGVPNGC